MTTNIIPVFRVNDAAASVEWYRQLGFELVFEHRFAPNMPAYVGIRRDEALIHLSEHTGDAPGPGLAYIWVEAVDPLAAIFGVTVDEMPWARDCEIVDPDGNRLRFAEAVGVT
jgi:catechol 2,3-dioxygenase-like lactoylglutathione lyase family enzyme